MSWLGCGLRRLRRGLQSTEDDDEDGARSGRRKGKVQGRKV